MTVSRFVIVGLLGMVTAGGWQAEARKKADVPAAKELTLADVKAPQDQETCFSPDEPCDLKLVKFIQSAQKSIDVAVYDVNLDQFVHHLLVQSKKVPVRVIIDRRQSKGEHSLASTLVRAGANVRYGKQRGIMHNKFTIVDGKMVETGSFNYTNGAANKNNENQIYLANPTVVGRYQQRFNEIWDEGKPVTKEELGELRARAPASE